MKLEFILTHTSIEWNSADPDDSFMSLIKGECNLTHIPICQGHRWSDIAEIDHLRHIFEHLLKIIPPNCQVVIKNKQKGSINTMRMEYLIKYVFHKHGSYFPPDKK